MSDVIQKGKIEYMDIAKGCAIILVVIGHSGAPITNFIYLFHMALFFFISGYFYKESYSDNPIKLLFKRLKTLYIPFLKYELIYLFLHNFFFRINVYSEKTGYQNQGSIMYSKEQFMYVLKSIIKFVGTEQLAGAFWFLTTLFFVNIIFVVISFLVTKIFKKYSEIFRFILVFACFILGNAFTHYNYEFYYCFNVSLVATFIYYLGYLYKKNELIIKSNIVVFLLALGLLIYNSFKGHIEMGANSYPSPVFFILSSLAGIYLTMYISKLLSNKRLRLLKYIGKNSFTIMALHFLCFKLVNLIQIRLYKYPDYMLAKFPYIDGSNGWWIIYTLSGVLVPIMFIFIYENTIRMVEKNYIRILFRYKVRNFN